MKQLVPRKYDRKRFLKEATIRSLPSGHPFRGQVVDLGQGGLSLFASRFVAIGEAVEVTFHLGDKKTSALDAAHTGRIVACQVLSEGNMLRIAFAQPLTPQEIESLETPVRK